MLIVTAVSAALLATSPVGSGSAAMQAEADLGAETLAQGRNADAIAELEARRAHDPAQLINLGIAYAREGDAERARYLFNAALTRNSPMELETADGQLTDSRRLARKALRMLDQGEFSAQPTMRTANRVTLRR